jgi:hypothetical protein
LPRIEVTSFRSDARCPLQEVAGAPLGAAKIYLSAAPRALMENKTFSDTERDILLKLREAVNSQEEFDWVEAELAALSAQEANAALKPTPINSVADAVEFLEEQCDLLAVQVEIVPPLWKVVRLDGAYEAMFSDIGLMDFARGERNARFRLATGRTVDSVTEPAPFAGGAA